MAFWKRTGDPQAELRAEYHELRRNAEKTAMPADRARLQNQAGDIALRLGDDVGAMVAFGDALDLYVRDHHYDAARAVGRKLLRVRPRTVRARSTLAWLAIAQDLPADARAALDDYVGALRADGQREIAVKHLTAMASATPDAGLRTAIAEYLMSLDAAQAADAVLGRVHAEAAGEKEPLTDDEMRVCWEEALDTLVSPDPNATAAKNETRT